MFKSLVFDPKEGLRQDLSLGDATKYLKTKRSVVWLDLFQPSKEEFDLIKDTFDFHPLSIEESKEKKHLPKVDFYDHRVFIIWGAIVDKPKTNKLEQAPLSIFLGQNYLITVHQEPIANLDLIYDVAVREPKSISSGPGWLLYLLLDSLVDDIFPVLDRLSEDLDRLENEIFADATHEQVKKLFVLKRQLLVLRKVVTPEREIVNLLSRHASELIKPETFIYFQDIYDHLIRIVDLIDTGRDIISGVMDIYLSTVSNRLNIVMKRLTIVATIFMPLTFIAGVYGMNFKYMPELYHPWSYFAIWGIMLALAASMLIYFKAKDWW